MLSKTTSLALLGLFATSASAHMIMGQPVPYGKDSLDNSPLDASGADFPCKQRSGVYTVTSENKLTAGAENPLTFVGSAVHGGGSCQLSLSKDREPTAKSSFKVIASYIGGCPGVDGPADFSYKIPDSIPNGEYALAWTWFNKVGNREMYMNCAPVTVSGSSAKDDSEMEKLPDMFVANIGNGVSDTEGTDLEFPDPGSVVVKGADAKPAPPTGSSTSGSGSSGSGNTGQSTGSGTSGSTSTMPAGSAETGSGSGSSSGQCTGSCLGGSGSSGSSASSGASSAAAGASSAASSAATSAAASSAPAGGAAAPSAGSSAAASNSGGVFAPGASSAASASSAPSASVSPTSTSTFTTMQTVTASPGSGSAASGNLSSAAPASPATSSAAGAGSGSAATSAAPAAPAGTGSTGGSTGSSTGQSCSTDGALLCSSDGTQFGLCNHGSAVMMPVAAGTKCSGGQITRRDTGEVVKRSAPKYHVHGGPHRFHRRSGWF